MDRTKEFLSHFPDVPTQSDAAVTQSPTDAASIEIIKILVTCLQRLDKLTPQAVRQPDSPFRFWLSGLCRDAGLKLHLTKPSLRDDARTLPSTVSELEDEVAQIRQSLQVARECTDALETQFLSTLKSKGKFALKSKTLPLLEQRQAVVSILRDFCQDLIAALQRYEVRALSWQVACNSVFSPHFVKDSEPMNTNPLFAQLYEKKVKAKLSDLQEDWKRSLLADSEETERVLEGVASKFASTQHSLASTPYMKCPEPEYVDPEVSFIKPTTELQVQKFINREEVAEEIVLDISTKLARITDLMSTFTHRVMEQKEVTNNILATTESAIDSMQMAGKYLSEASKRKWTYKSVLFLGYIGCAFFLLVLDLLTTWRLI